MEYDALGNNLVFSAESRAIQAAYAAWLKPFSWDFWVWLTFAEEITVSAAKRIIELRYLRCLTNYGKGPVSYFGAIEGGGDGRRVHSHLVLTNARGRIDARAVSSFWRKYGWAGVRTYEPSRHGVEYCAKVLASPDPDRLLLRLPKGPWPQRTQ